MRGKLAIVNTSAALLQEIVAIVCAFILPRLIMQAFGSTYNGITSSITQFLGCAVLLRAGIGGATRAALYGPIARNDIPKISAIMCATRRYMYKIALLLALLILGFAGLYPFLVADEFSWLFSFSLFVIIGISTFAETLFGITNLIWLQANQQLYVSSGARIASTILNTVLSVILIRAGCSIHVVKLGSAAAFCLYPVLLAVYVHRHFRFGEKVPPDNGAIRQRWDVFFHQVAGFVMSNTAIIILTAFVSMAEVSVFSVYNLVASGIRKLVLNFTNGLEAAFGNMMASDGDDVLAANFRIMQFVVFSAAVVVYSTAALLILDFVRLYVRGITDAEYVRPLFSAVLIAGQFFLCVRQPYQVLVQAGGHYRRTRNGAIAEPILNIAVSVAVVAKYGLVGVAFGTLAATVFRTFQFAWFISENVLPGTFRSMLWDLLLAGADFALIGAAVRCLPLGAPHSYGAWLLHAAVVSAVAVGVVAATAFLFHRRECRGLFLKLGRIVHPRKRESAT
jgi:hypothetical protein